MKYPKDPFQKGNIKALEYSRKRHIKWLAKKIGDKELAEQFVAELMQQTMLETRDYYQRALRISEFDAHELAFGRKPFS